jgi:hypothetical protein
MRLSSSSLDDERDRMKPDVETALQRDTPWTPKEALQFYSDGKHFDTVNGRTRILDAGAIASNALKRFGLDRMELKGDSELAALHARVAMLEEANGMLEDGKLDAETERDAAYEAIKENAMGFHRAYVCDKCGKTGNEDEGKPPLMVKYRWPERYGQVEAWNDFDPATFCPKCAAGVLKALGDIEYLSERS